MLFGASVAWVDVRGPVGIVVMARIETQITAPTSLFGVPRHELPICMRVHNHWVLFVVVLWFFVGVQLTALLSDPLLVSPMFIVVLDENFGVGVLLVVEVGVIFVIKS